MSTISGTGRPSARRQLAGDELGDERLRALARAAELQDVQAVVVGLDEPGHRAALAQRRDVAGGGHRPRRRHRGRAVAHGGDLSDRETGPARAGIVAAHEDTAMSALPIGFGMGLLVAAQIGPMSLFLIRSVLRGSLRTGLAIGGGIAVVDTLYAAAGAAGAAPCCRSTACASSSASPGRSSWPSSACARSTARSACVLAPRPTRRSRRRGALRHLARRDGLEPADDRVVGGALRRRLRRRRGGHAGVGGRAARGRRPREPDDGEHDGARRLGHPPVGRARASCAPSTPSPGPACSASPASWATARCDEP